MFFCQCNFIHRKIKKAFKYPQLAKSPGTNGVNSLKRFYNKTEKQSTEKGKTTVNRLTCFNYPRTFQMHGNKKGKKNQCRIFPHTHNHKRDNESYTKNQYYHFCLVLSKHLHCIYLE